MPGKISDDLTKFFVVEVIHMKSLCAGSEGA